jgi:hypothetical protein
MIDSVSQAISHHLRVYGDLLAKEWREMTPMMYGSLLVLIAAVGFLLMKSGTKGPGQ